MTRNKLSIYGMIYMLNAAFFFSLMNATLKLLSSNITINENLFLRGGTMSIFVLLALIFRNKTKRHANKKGGYWKLLFRAFVGSIALYALLYNISTISLGTSVAFSQSTPIYTAIFSWILLREKPNLIIIISVVIGFLGVILISNPQTSDLEITNIIFGIASGVFSALAFISVRALRGYFDDFVIILSFGLMTALLGLILMVFQESISLFSLNSIDYFYICFLGISGTIAQYYMTKAYMFAPAAIVAPIDYTRIIFSLILGILLGDAIPNLYTIFGMFLVIVCGVLVSLPFILKELQKHKKL